MEVSRLFSLNSISNTTNESSSINIKSLSVDDKLVRSVADDVPPIRIDGDTAGGNHGYLVNEVSGIPLGEYSDLNGTLWTVGRYRNLTFCARSDGIKSISPSKLMKDGVEYNPTVSSSYHQLYNFKRDEVKVVKVDGADIKGNTTTNYSNEVNLIEKYNIVSRKSSISGGDDVVCEVNNTYTINSPECLIIETKVNFIKDTSVEGTHANFMFMQAQRSNSVKYIVPKMKSKEQGGKVYDMSIGHNASSFAENLEANPNDFNDDVWYADRVLTVSKDGIYTAIGLLPVFDCDPLTRRVKASRRGLYVKGGTSKIYFEVRSLQSKVNKGEVFHAKGYRTVAKNINNVLTWTVPHGEVLYQYIHFLDNAEVELPKGTVIDSYKVSINLGRVRGSEGSCLVVMSK